MKANNKIRKILRIHDIKHWQLADALGITPETLCRKLRHELPEHIQQQYIDVINNMEKIKDNYEQ